jgi:hypothetical protein
MFRSSLGAKDFSDRLANHSFILYQLYQCLPFDAQVQASCSCCDLYATLLLDIFWAAAYAGLVGLCYPTRQNVTIQVSLSKYLCPAPHCRQASGTLEVPDLRNTSSDGVCTAEASNLFLRDDREQELTELGSSFLSVQRVRLCAQFRAFSFQ